MDVFWFFAGIAAYYKLEGDRLANESARDDAIEKLRLRAQSMQDELKDMEFHLISEPKKYSARQIRAAQQRADRAEGALLLALASVTDDQKA